MEQQFLKSVGRTELLRIITEYFSEDEIKTLCFTLNINYDNLPGPRKEDKARELVVYCEHFECVPALIKEVFSLRPNINLSNMIKKISREQLHENNGVHDYYPKSDAYRDACADIDKMLVGINSSDVDKVGKWLRQAKRKASGNERHLAYIEFQLCRLEYIRDRRKVESDCENSGKLFNTFTESRKEGLYNTYREAKEYGICIDILKGIKESQLRDMNSKLNVMVKMARNDKMLLARSPLAILLLEHIDVLLSEQSGNAVSAEVRDTSQMEQVNRISSDSPFPQEPEITRSFEPPSYQELSNRPEEPHPDLWP